MTDEPIDWHARYEAELLRRRRAEHKAERANDVIEPMRARLAKLERAEASRRRWGLSRTIVREQDMVARLKLDLIDLVIHDQFFPTDPDEERS